jgi:hypothetical protein
MTLPAERAMEHPDDQWFEVWSTRFDGTAHLYQSYAKQEIAESVAAALRRVGLPCEVRLAHH